MNRKLIPLIAAAAIAAGLLTYTVIDKQGGSGGSAPMHFTLLDAPRALPDFELVDHSGESFTAAELSGHWSILFFGFANCPDICPTTLYDLARFRKAISDLGPDQQPSVHFVSVDPARDTPQQLARYVAAFDNSFTGVTGDDAQIARLASALGVAYGQEPDEAGGYTVLHTAALFLLDPQGRFVGVSSAPHDAGQLERDYRALIARRGT